MSSRQPAVAGTFYPDNPAVLHQNIVSFLNEAEQRNPHENNELKPKVLVVPHAGHMFSGSIAASGYCLLKHFRQQISRVVLLGPSHRVPLRGVAIPSQESFTTPLGDIALDKALLQEVNQLPFAGVADAPHELEHSLEVHLPFLQEVLDDFSLLPLVVGATHPEEVASLLDKVWGGDETLIVISTDLSHFHNYDQANAIDSYTARKILGFDYSLEGEEACGSYPLNGLLYLAGRKKLRCEMVDLRNSGDTAGDKSRVVGYGTFAFYE